MAVWGVLVGHGFSPSVAGWVGEVMEVSQSFHAAGLIESRLLHTKLARHRLQHSVSANCYSHLDIAYACTSPHVTQRLD
eukprot:4798315-Amphidinium_carterae.1